MKSSVGQDITEQILAQFHRRNEELDAHAGPALQGSRRRRGDPGAAEALRGSSWPTPP